MPDCRQTYPIGIPDSASRKTDTICSSENFEILGRSTPSVQDHRTYPVYGTLDLLSFWGGDDKSVPSWELRTL